MRTSDMRDDNFDRELDAALAKYAAVEPRDGLEERVLANLRARREHGVSPNWRPWSLAVAGVAVAIFAAVAFWHGATTKGVTRRPATTSQRPAALMPAPEPAEDENNLKSQMPKLKEQRMPRKYALVERIPAGNTPKLEQFPAPEPLSEQEELLVRFVQDDPRDAALVAEARTEELSREEDELRALSGPSGEPELQAQ
jgi:hypothetical protein